MRVTRLALSGSLVVALLALSGCSEDTGPVDDGDPIPDPLLYATFVTPRGGPAFDPLLADAYQNVGADGYDVAALWLRWSDVVRSETIRNWIPLNLHLQRAHQKGIRLSVVLDLYPGGDPDFPAWKWPLFPGYESGEVYSELVRFLEQLSVRGGSDIAYLWLGQEPERFLDLYPDEEAAFTSFFAALADTARAVFPEARVGLAFDPDAVAARGRAAFIGGLRPAFDVTGLLLMPGAIESPEGAVLAMRQAVEPWLGSPTAILQAGYPSDGASDEATQNRFMGLFLDWLGQRPPTLQMVCWMPLHDASSALAESLALERRPFDETERSRYAAMLEGSGMRRLDGSPKPARQTFVEERP